MRHLLITLLGFVCAACTTVEFEPTASTEIHPPYKGQVEVLREFPAAGSYRHLGVVSMTGRTLSKVTDMVAALTKKAAEHGANAVVLQGKPKEIRTSSGDQTKFAGFAIWRLE